MSKRVPAPRVLLHLQSAVMFPDDVTRRRKPETVAVGTRRKERLEDPLQCRFVHAAPRIGNRNHDEAAGIDFDLRDPPGLADLACPDLDLDDTWFVHRLDRIVADVQDDLLQLRWFGRNDRRFRSSHSP